MGNDNKMMWGILIHLGYNMWREEDSPFIDESAEYTRARSTLLCDLETWDLTIGKMAKDGLNTLLIDLGEGIKYESHPELAVKGSWTVAKLREQLEKIREMGITPIPKLNFSSAHDEWLGEYSRCLSTSKYYEVLNDLINEVIDIFETPKLFHLGMDEETYGHQRYYNYAYVRHYDAWWKDFYYLIDLVEKRNVQGWVWSDYIWNNQDTFLKKMPKSVLQSNWYYGRSFSVEKNNSASEYVRAYKVLEEHGYDQVPTGSNWSCRENFERTVCFTKENISPERLKGFLQAPWEPTIYNRRYYLLDSVEQVAQAKDKYYSK